MNQQPTGELATKAFNGAKVFSATMAQDREFLGDKVTAWIQNHPRRQIVDTNNTTLIQRDCAFDHILELTHISRPRVRRQALHTLLIGSDSRWSWSMLPQEVRHEQMKILAPLSQRRQMQLNNIQTIEQVTSESPGSRKLLEIGITRSDHSCSNFNRLVAADRNHLTLLQHSQ